MRKTRGEVVRPAALDEAGRQRLLEETWAVHAQVFSGGTFEKFVRYIVDPTADENTVLVHRDGDGRAVGYFSARAFKRTLRGKPCLVLRGVAASLREYRGDAANLRFAFAEAARLVLRHPGRQAFYFGIVLHPTSYLQLTRFLSPVWPSRTHPVDPETEAFMVGLGDEFGMVRVDDERPLLRRADFFTADTEAERSYWRRCPKPDARFYLDRNPRYAAGQGLLTLVPISPATLAVGLGRVLDMKARQQIEAARGRVQRLPVASRWLLPAEIRRRLRGVELFAGLDDRQLAALAERARLQEVRGGHVLFRQGDPGDGLYVVERGAVQVVVDGADGAERVLDQLDPGDVVGEIATLSGEPRTATARAATRAALIRLDGEAIRAAMEADPRLAEAIRSRYRERRFDTLAAGIDALGTTRVARLERLRAGRPLALEADGAHLCEAPGWLFLSEGEAEVTGSEHLRARAPFLLAVAPGTRVVARGEARGVML